MAANRLFTVVAEGQLLVAAKSLMVVVANHLLAWIATCVSVAMVEHLVVTVMVSRLQIVFVTSLLIAAASLRLKVYGKV